MHHKLAALVLCHHEVGLTVEDHVAAVTELLRVDQPAVVVQVYQRAVRECHPILFVMIGGDTFCLFELFHHIFRELHLFHQLLHALASVIVHINVINHRGVMSALLALLHGQFHFL